MACAGIYHRLKRPIVQWEGAAKEVPYEIGTKQNEAGRIIDKHVRDAVNARSDVSAIFYRFVHELKCRGRDE